MKLSNAAQQLQNNLDEMKRRDDLESLRTHLIFENCFPPNKNPETGKLFIIIFMVTEFLLFMYFL